MFHSECSLSLRQIERIPLVRPKRAGPNWTGIKHGDFLNAILNDATRRNWSVGQVRGFLSENRRELAAEIPVAIPDFPASPDMRFFPRIGVRTSNDRRHAPTIYIGAFHAVSPRCNLVMAATPSQKLTALFMLESYVERSLDTVPSIVKSIPIIFDEMDRKEYKLEIEEVDHILMVAARLGWMPYSRLGKVIDGVRLVSGSSKKISRQALLVAFACVAQSNPPLLQMEQIHNFRRLIGG